MRRLPPLSTLRVFEAAARHLSFTRAADELHVTQAAVSHQIRALEASLGLRLFRRLNRALLLTEHGQAYLPAVRRAFEVLRDATDRLTEAQARGTLTTSMLPSFAARWLVPRLGRFRERYPDIDVRISPSASLVDFARDDVDCAIRYGRGSYPGLHVERLLTEDIFPVCSPRLLSGPGALRAPADLARVALLHDDGHGVWRTWLREAGVEGVDAGRGYVFADSSLLVQAAVEGQGVALARGVLAADELARGTLVRPFPLALSTEFAYYFVCPLQNIERPKIVAFRDWLREEVARQAGGDATADTPSQARPGADAR